MAEISTRIGPHPDIGTAWLVLSHGAFINSIIASSGLAVAFLIFAFSNTFRLGVHFQELAIGWNITSLIISAWTLYAIITTWTTAREWPVSDRIFDDFAFYFLIFVTFVVTLFNAWTLRLGLMWYKMNYNKRGSDTNNVSAIG